MRALPRIARAVADATRVNRQFLRSPEFRRAAMNALAAPSTPLELSAAAARELDAAPNAAQPYAGLSGAALAFTALVRSEREVPSVRVVLADYDPQRIFAGVKTALQVADKLAERLGVSLQVIILNETVTARHRKALRDDIVTRLHRDPSRISVLTRDGLVRATTHPRDVWVATHWTTAHPLQVATRVGALDPNRVIYLVQDHEPGFTALSTDRFTSSETYRAGFHLLVNSEPVAAVLRSVEKVEVNGSAVFAPELDLDQLAAITARRAARDRRPGPATVFFYGRPSKPRNLFPLGVAALKVAARSLPSAPVRWVSAGEPHREIELGGGHSLESLGTLSWPRYFELLSTTDVMLSLQASPHPSHPPLEAALVGVFSITNEVSASRGALHPLLTAVDADPEALGLAVANAVRRAPERQAVAAVGPAGLTQLASLGGSLDAALDHVTNMLV